MTSMIIARRFTMDKKTEEIIHDIKIKRDVLKMLKLKRLDILDDLYRMDDKIFKKEQEIMTLSELPAKIYEREMKKC